MLSCGQKPVAANGRLCIFFVQIPHVLSVIDGLSPEDTVGFLRHYLEVYEAAIGKLGGRVARAESNCILAAWAWDESKSGQDYVDIALSLVRQKNELAVWTSDHKCQPANILISISQGECTYEMADDNYTQILGLVVAKVEQMANQCSGGGDAVLIDESIRELPIQSSVTAVCEDVFRVNQ